MNEATCKAAVAKLLRTELLPRGGIVWRHEDSFSGGIPDLSATLGRRTVWAEFKLHRPGRRARLTELQADALERTRGLLVEYAVAKDGRLSVLVTVRGPAESVGTFMKGAPPSRRSGPVHRAVVDSFLYFLEGDR